MANRPKPAEERMVFQPPIFWVSILLLRNVSLPLQDTLIAQREHHKDLVQSQDWADARARVLQNVMEVPWSKTSIFRNLVFSSKALLAVNPFLRHDSFHLKN